MNKTVIVLAFLWPSLWCADSLQGGDYSMLPAASPEMTGPGVAPEKAPGHTVLAEGVLLIAGKNLLDPNFARAVILITEYDAQGTTGLVLNRPTKIPVSHALPQLKELAEHPETIHSGGPVAANLIHLLVKSDLVPQGAKQLVDNIFMVDSMETLRQLELEGNNKNEIRVYMGFSGWAPGQLETELLHGDWYIWPASSTVIFSKNPENIWYELIYLATAKWT